MGEPERIRGVEVSGNLFAVLGNAGIEIVDTEQKYRDEKLSERRGGDRSRHVFFSTLDETDTLL